MFMLSRRDELTISYASNLFTRTQIRYCDNTVGND